MKTPRKVIEKISLPLMFVMFVMAVLVFAVSPVSAQDLDPLCEQFNFCDRDGDLYIRDHKKCVAAECVGKGPDCDDTNDEIFGLCDNGGTTPTVYTAELTSGAFRFADSISDSFNSISFNSIIDPIYVITGRISDNGLGPLLETDVEMWRPNCGGWEPDAGNVPRENPKPSDYPTTKTPDGADIDAPGPWPNIDGPLTCADDGDPCYKNCTYELDNGVWIPDWDLVETWDRMFAIGCPELGTSKDYKIERILSTYGDWDFSEPGNYRLILRDIRLQGSDFVDWDVTMQLIAHGDDYDYIRGTGEWLPDEFDPPDVHEFFLEKGKMWGREVSGGGPGGPGGRKSCHQAFSGTDERMEGFFLYDPLACDEDCKDAATSVMEIVNPLGEYPWVEYP